MLQGLELEIQRARHRTSGSTEAEEYFGRYIDGFVASKLRRLLVDGVDLYDPNYSDRLVSWRAAVARIPQSTVLQIVRLLKTLLSGFTG